MRYVGAHYKLSQILQWVRKCFMGVKKIDSNHAISTSKSTFERDMSYLSCGPPSSFHLNITEGE